MKKYLSGILFLVPGIVMVLFIVFVALPGAKKSAQLQTLEVEATVVSCEEYNVLRFGELENAYDITSTYVVDGNVYEIHEKKNGAPRKVGEKFTLYVDPNDPYNYATTTNPYEVLWATIPGFFFILLGIIGIRSRGEG